MGNHDVGRAFAAAADVFWLVAPDQPSREMTLKALEAVGNRYRGADAEFDDDLLNHTTPLGRMVAIAFDATPEEMGDVDDEETADAWFDGPYTRFRQHFGLT
jgi:hypothetical protein